MNHKLAILQNDQTPSTPEYSGGSLGDPLRVLRISHSDVVRQWRGRQRRLKQRGVDITTITSTQWQEGGAPVRQKSAVSQEEGPVVAVRTAGRHPILFLYNPFPLWKLMRREWDVIDIHEEPYSLSAAEVKIIAWLARSQSPTILYSAQNIDRRLPFPFGWIEHRLIASTSAFSVCNREAKARLVARGARAERVCIIGLGFSPRQFFPIENWDVKKTGLDSDRCAGATIVYSGRMVRCQKGIETLLHAVQLMKPRKIRLVLVGGGPDLAYFHDLSIHLGLSEEVKFIGNRTPDQMGDVYRHSDIAVVPSIDTDKWKEQFGRVAIEAMACGLPVVTSDTPALVEACGGYASVFPQGDAEKLRILLSRLLDDASRMRDQVLEARERVYREYSWSVVGDKYLRLYNLARTDRT